MHWVTRGTGTPKDKDEVNRRDCFKVGGEHRRSFGGSGSIHGQIAQAELLKLQKSGQFPDEPVRIKGAQIHYVTSQTYYQYQT